MYIQFVVSADIFNIDINHIRDFPHIHINRAIFIDRNKGKTAEIVCRIVGQYYLGVWICLWICSTVIRGRWVLILKNEYNQTNQNEGQYGVLIDSWKIHASMI